MRRLSVTSLAALSLAVSQGAQAQNWSGYYIGINAGVARGESSASSTVLDLNSPNTWISSVNGGRFNSLLSGESSGTQFIGGIQVGRNWQTGSLVYGIELDASAVNLSMSRAGRVDWPGYGPGFGTTSAHTDWMLSTRGRLGFVVGPALLYGTAGLAATDLKISGGYSDSRGAGGSASGSWSSRNLRLGWTAGGGLEWALDSKWSIKTEYTFTQFRAVEANGTIYGTPGTGYSNGVTTKADLSAHVARAGLNYKF